MTPAAEGRTCDMLAIGQHRIRWSERIDGDFHLEGSPALLHEVRRNLVDLPWTQLDQCHGSSVVIVTAPGANDRSVGDALISDVDGAVLAIWTGDCAPVAFVTGSAWFGTAHAGWRGIERGVLAATVDSLRSRTGTTVRAVLGPCIHPCCYEFGVDDLARFEQRFGPSVRATTAWGAPALDVPATVRAALAELDVALDDRSSCTGCAADRFFSHRVRGDAERQVMAVWRALDTEASVA